MLGPEHILKQEHSDDTCPARNPARPHAPLLLARCLDHHMLTLTLFRHAKSSWDDPDIEDHERPLAKRGTLDAPRMARWLADWSADNGRPIDLIICSDAVRTRATIALAMPEITRRIGKRPPPQTPAIETDAALYLATPEVILERLAKVAAASRHVVVVGHNPGLHMLALALVGSGDGEAIAALAQKFPTSAIAIFESAAGAFGELRLASGKLAAFMTPKRL